MFCGASFFIWHRIMKPFPFMISWFYISIACAQWNELLLWREHFYLSKRNKVYIYIYIYIYSPNVATFRVPILSSILLCFQYLLACVCMWMKCICKDCHYLVNSIFALMYTIRWFGSSHWMYIAQWMCSSRWMCSVRWRETLRQYTLSSELALSGECVLFGELAFSLCLEWHEHQSLSSDPRRMCGGWKLLSRTKERRSMGLRWQINGNARWRDERFTWSRCKS